MAPRKRKPLTEEQKAKQSENQRIWRERNRDRVRQLKKDYYQRNREQAIKRIAEWRRQNRDIYLAKKNEWQRRYRAALKATIQSAANPDEVRMAALERNEIFAAAARAVPRGMPSWKRDDIIGDIVLAVLEGTIAADEIATRAKEFIRAFNRQFSEYAHVEFNEAFMSVAAE